MSAVATRKLPAGAIEASLGGLNIVLRERDGYVNATRLCKDGGKEFKHWRENKKTSAFLECLSSVVGISITAVGKATTGSATLLDISQGGDPSLQGTWVHPRVATNLAQWISPEYDVLVSGVMERFHRGDLTLAAEVVRQHDAAHGVESEVTIVTRDPKRKADVEIWQLELENRERHVRVLRLEMELLRDLGVFDEACRAFFGDCIKNQPLLTNGSAEGPTAREWPVVNRAQHLGLRVRPGSEAALGKFVRKGFFRETGREPRKKTVFHKDVARDINVYDDVECEACVDRLIRAYFEA